MHAMDDFLDKMSVPRPTPREVGHYLDMTRSELELQPAEELESMAFDIANWAYYVQDLYNQQSVKAGIAKAEIDKIIAPVLDQYQYCNSEEKRIRAVNDNDQAMSYQEIETKARLVMTRIDHLARRIEEVKRTMLTIAETKKRREREYG